ncbi:hypothetical protein [Glutamicibacter arilaitensis]|uniref:hypothetical protein n=1 Tax=Glutamicibacter arilaitensis TaxID=256701 RepID=UPI003F8DB955
MKQSCVVCGSEATAPWTLMHGAEEATVAALCDTHAAPIQAIIHAAVEASPNGIPAIVRPKREPLKPLDWTPPK